MNSELVLFRGFFTWDSKVHRQAENKLWVLKQKQKQIFLWCKCFRISKCFRLNIKIETCVTWKMITHDTLTLTITLTRAKKLHWVDNVKCQNPL